MESPRDKILSDALALTEDERLELAHVLYQSVKDEPVNLHPDWDGEIRRRIEEIDNGTAEMVPGDEFMRKLKELVGGG